MREQTVCAQIVWKQKSRAQTEQPGGLFTGARRQRRKSRHLNQKSEICFCGSPIFCCGNRVWMCELLIQSQARSRGKGSRADAKADAWEKGEQALFCQSPGGALTACELGNGTWNVPFPDRARTLPRETNKPPGQAARNAAAGFAALFRRRGSWLLPSPRPHKKELTCVSSFLYVLAIFRAAGQGYVLPRRARFPHKITQQRSFGERRSFSRMKRMSAGRKMHSDTKKFG